MSMTASFQDRPHHPWLEAFLRAPVAEFGDLLAGFARIPPYERADAPDAARMLFGPLDADDPARRALGPAILGWLEQRRRQAPPLGLPGLQSWVREVCEAFEIVAFLGVADAAADQRLAQRRIIADAATLGVCLGLRCRSFGDAKRFGSRTNSTRSPPTSLILGRTAVSSQCRSFGTNKNAPTAPRVRPPIR